MTLVVDASVAVKWVIDEEGSAAAIELIRAEQLAAPDFMLLECANVLAMRVRRGLLTDGQARARLTTLLQTPVREIPSRNHLARAQVIATELGQSVYDSLYLAVALAEGAEFVTADAAFARAAQARPDFSAAVRLL